MDSWLTQEPPIAPEKSPATALDPPKATKHLVSGLIGTAENVKAKYKETARGGLAVNVIEC